MKIPIDRVQPNPEQPRTQFDEGELRGLADSIRAVGLIQPIVVERALGGKYTLVDGERRWRAVKLLKQKTIEAVIRDRSNHPGKNTGTNGSGRERRMASLVANVQRTDLSPIDQAKAYQVLLDELGTMEAVARHIGKDSHLITMRLALLNFSEPVRALFDKGKLPLIGDLVFKAQKLPFHEQNRILILGATRGWTGLALLAAVAQAAKKNGKAAPVRVKKSKPEMQVELAGAHFDALALVARWRGLPGTMIEQARKTCMACDLYEQAGESLCKRCPLPDFLNRCRLSMTIEGEKR